MLNSLEQARELFDAPVLGRIPGRQHIGVVDIGSNSVRLIVYEDLTRAPAPVYNEKALCGLGRSVGSSGAMDDEAVASALNALKRFKLICNLMDVRDCSVIATAAVREASNGAKFAKDAEAILGWPIEVLSGGREAQLSAFGVMAGIEAPDGIVGDLGGGSFELIDVGQGRTGEGITLPLGVLRLADMSGGSIKKATKIIETALSEASLIEAGAKRAFYAVGGTFRSLARLHMAQCNYPLHVIHNYALTPEEAIDFARVVSRVDVSTLDSIDQISSARRELLPFGALVLEKLIEAQQPSEIVLSSLGVREGFLYEKLDAEPRARDPLIDSAMELAQLRSRSPRHAVELCNWTDAFMTSSNLGETAAEKRLRHAACLLADIGWRAHPDYRGEQSMNIILHANFTGVDHPSRAFMAMAVYLRHEGLSNVQPPTIRELITARMLDRARILAGALRVAYTLSAAMPGVLADAPLLVNDDDLILTLPDSLSALDGERVQKRLKQLAKLIGREPLVKLTAD